MKLGSPSLWIGRVLAAVATILVVAVGARFASAVLAPIVPDLILSAMLLTIFLVAFGVLRRRK
jgi:hypothetical protein